MSAKGLVVAAPMSRSGKTTVTLGLIRALHRAGLTIRAAKGGPDYIDTSYLASASGQPAHNLDAFAMNELRLRSAVPENGNFIVEGAMGLFDGAPPEGKGSVADLAEILGLPILLVVNCSSLAQSVAPVVSGFLTHRPNLNFVGVILNQVGSARHEMLLRAALHDMPVPILGAVHRRADLTKPSRHLGLVQAQEDTRLDSWLDALADHIETCCDIDAVAAAFAPLTSPPPNELVRSLPPLGHHIAIAKDAAFSFTYHHMETDWRNAGASISYFSPLDDQPPNEDADAIFLPGGYPELYCKPLARAGTFRQAMRDAAAKKNQIYGECGGYMVLGQSIEDKTGTPYPMTGLLDLETSFAVRKLHLGYRHLKPLAGPFSGELTAHEFHYATITYQKGKPLFHSSDALGNDLGQIGLVNGSVSGSFAHIIDVAPE